VIIFSTVWTLSAAMWDVPMISIFLYLCIGKWKTI
jgi:hypothetical protein